MKDGSFVSHPTHRGFDILTSLRRAAVGNSPPHNITIEETLSAVGSYNSHLAKIFKIPIAPETRKSR